MFSLSEMDESFSIYRRTDVDVGSESDSSDVMEISNDSFIGKKKKDNQVIVLDSDEGKMPNIF